MKFDLDAYEGREVEHEFLGLRRLDDGRLEDAVFLGAAEGAAGLHFLPQIPTRLRSPTVIDGLDDLDGFGGTRSRDGFKTGLDELDGLITWTRNRAIRPPYQNASGGIAF